MSYLTTTPKTIYLILSGFLLFHISCKNEKVLPNVNANFIGDKTTILVGESVTLNDLSSGEPTVWKWEFEGGNPSSSTEQNPVVLYAQAGTYNVRLTSANDENSDIEIKERYITVYPTIKADFSSDKTTILTGGTIDFRDLSAGDPNKWDWNFEGGKPAFSENQNPSIVYSEPGTYSVKLISSSNQDSDTEVKIDFIKVLPEITAGFNLSDSVFNQGENLICTDISDAEPAEWLWEFEGGTPSTSKEKNPSVTFPEAGIFKIKLTVSNLLSSDSITKKVISMPAEQLIAHYPFNGSPSDVTGNGNDGQENGNIQLTTDRFGIENSAYEFDGYNDFISTSAMFDYPIRTLSLWVNPYDITGDNSTAKFVISQDGYQLDYGLLRVAFKNNILDLYAGGFEGNYIKHDITINQWMHLVLVRDNNLTKYYVDNQLMHVATADTISSTFEPNPYFIIGAGRSTNKQFYKGKIDDIRIYQKALNELEIHTLYLGK
jgi:PKD repeat protein